MNGTVVSGHRQDVDRFAEDARFAVEAALWAPSVHNTQPWRFGVGERRISVRGDVERRLEVADPAGREMLISCGAAVFTLGLALRWRGYVPQVRLLPDPDRPQPLAEVTVDGPAGEATEDVGRLLGQVRLRRTHRGPFLPVPVPAGLPPLLREEARREGAALHVITDDHTVGALAALTQAGEHLLRLDPDYDAEVMRWAPAPGSRRANGVHEGTYPRADEDTEPHFAARDFAGGHGWGTAPDTAAAAPDRTLGTIAPTVVEALGPVVHRTASARWSRCGSTWSGRRRGRGRRTARRAAAVRSRWKEADGTAGAAKPTWRSHHGPEPGADRTVAAGSGAGR